MVLRVVTGRAGTGKSHLLMGEMVKKSAEEPFGKPLIFLVPEQASFNAEWSLLNDFGIEGSFRIKVCGFRKLFNLVAAEKNVKLQPWLNDMGKSMILRRLVDAHRNDFTVFGKAARHKGFVDNLRLIMDELAKFEISDQALVGAGEYFIRSDKNKMIGEKLNDIAMIYGEYQSIINDNYCDETRLMHILADLIAESQLLADAEIYIDGFTDFDPAQIAVLKALIKKCRNVSFALLMDNTEVYNEDSVFAFPEKTYCWLRDYAEAEKITFVRTHLSENHRHRNHNDLRKIEYGFAKKRFSFKDKKQVDCDSVQVVKAKNTEEQLAYIAETILSKARDCGYRMSDFAILSRDLEQSKSLICDTLDKYDIPHFADIAKSMYHHPLVETVLAMLETENEKWQSAAVLRFLKTGLLSVDDFDLCVLENYALANGIKGTYWQKAGQWERYYENNRDLMKSDNAETVENAKEKLAKVNETGLKYLSPLLSFHQSVKALSKNNGKYLLSEIINCIYDFLSDVNAEEILEGWVSEAAAEGRSESAAFHGQIYKEFCGVLQQLADFLGDTYVTLAEVYDLVAEGGSKLELNSIPPAVDEVMVSDISRSRISNVKCVFVIDCNEGIFPTGISDDGLLNSQEREELRTVGLNLAVGQRELQFAEDYHIYMALTRACEELHLCYSEFDSKGGIIQPSVVLENLQILLPDLQVINYNSVNKNAFMIFDNRAVIEAAEKQIAAAKAGEAIDDIWWQILKYYQDKGLYREEINALKFGADFQKDKGVLAKEIVDALYGNTNTTSVSRVEVYNKCPCMYYGRYGLKLEERDEYKISYQDVGNIYHDILANVLKALTEGNADFANLTAADLRPLIVNALNEYNGNGIGSLLDDSGKNRYLCDKIIAVVTGCLLDISFHMAQGNFRPVEFEASFGKNSKINGLTLVLPSGKKITIHGFIDRVDKAVGENDEYLRIIDYKSSDKNLNLSDIYYGLKWQMPIYLEALLNSEKDKGRQNIKPAGMFYFPIQPKFDAVDKPDDSTGWKVQKLQGLIILDTEAIQLAENKFYENSIGLTMDLKLLKNGNFGKNDRAVSPDDYLVVQNYIKKHLADNIDNILQGDVKQYPVLDEKGKTCDYCEFKQLCILDNTLLMDGRKITKISANDALMKMKQDLWEKEENENID